MRSGMAGLLQKREGCILTSIPKRIWRRPVAVLAPGEDGQTGCGPVDPPVAVGRAEYRDVGPPVTVVVARDRNVRRGAKLMHRICRAAAVCDKPLTGRGAVNGDIGL